VVNILNHDILLSLSLLHVFVSPNNTFLSYRTIVRFVVIHEPLHFSWKYIALSLVKTVVKKFFLSDNAIEPLVSVLLY
jgi:hypothetical protein